MRVFDTRFVSVFSELKPESVCKLLKNKNKEVWR